MEFYEVGGCVRDEIMGVKSKDIDFSVVLSDHDDHEGWLLYPGQGTSALTPFEAMVWQLEREGLNIVVKSPEHFTVRAVAKKPFRGHTGGLDFVLARKEGTYTDGRRPDKVELGTLMDDLSRRDFTMNAIAKDADGNLIDPFGGVQDIRARLIRCVGSAQDRIMEDALRGLRAMRFAITKDMQISGEIVGVLRSQEFTDALASVSKERQREEVEKMFATDTIRAMKMFSRLPNRVMNTVFSDGLRLSATMKG